MRDRAFLLSLLQCPRCHSRITVTREAVCSAGHRFRVVDGIPVMSIDDGSENVEKQHAHQRDFYGKVFAPGRKYVLENWQRAFLQRMSRLWERGEASTPFLDSGAGGDAYAVLEAVRRGVAGVGCDLSLEAMQSASQIATAHGVEDNCLFVVASAEALPFADGAFGSCASIAVLEHVPDDDKAIAELSRVTRSGARVYLCVPNRLESTPRPLRPIYRTHDRRVGHLRHYSAEQLASKCESVGLGMVEVQYSAHWAKVFQLGFDIALRALRVPHDRLWWWLEGVDARATNRPDGLQLHVIAERIASN